MSGPALFRADAKDPDSTYRFLRDDPRASDDRQLAERLWLAYWPYADAEFYNDIPRDFVARFWEMDRKALCVWIEIPVDFGPR